jgi:hypothetical protein
MEIREVVVHSIDGARYQIQFEQAATKGVLGFKVTANGDNKDIAKAEAEELLAFALKRSSLYKGDYPETNGNGK